MKITEWFDPTVIEHIRAYKHLQYNGFWPDGFIPKGMEFPEWWLVIIVSKMADQWVDLVLSHTESE